jgi:hypothetical protein
VTSTVSIFQERQISTIIPGLELGGKRRTDLSGTLKGRVFRQPLANEKLDGHALLLNAAITLMRSTSRPVVEKGVLTEYSHPSEVC